MWAKYKIKDLKQLIKSQTRRISRHQSRITFLDSKIKANEEEIAKLKLLPQEEHID